MIASDSLMQLLNTNSLTLYILTSVCKFSVLLSIYISHGTEKDNLFHNRELHEFAIISTIPMTLASDPVGKYSWDKLDAGYLGYFLPFFQSISFKLQWYYHG